MNLGAKEGTTLYRLLDHARIAFEGIKKDPIYAADYDSSVSYYLDYLKEKTEGKNIYQLTAKELEQVYDAMKQIYELIRRSTKLIRENKYKDVRDEGKRVMQELEDAKGISDWAANHKIGRSFHAAVGNLLNPYRFFRRISGYHGGALMRAYEDLNEGQRKMLRIQQEAENITSATFQEKSLQKLMKQMDTKKGMVDSGLCYKDGSRVMITKGMRMAIVMHGMNEGNMKHMRYGGLKVPDMKLYAKGDIAGAYDTKNIKLVKGITKAKVDAMEMEMSVEEKQMLKSFKRLFHEYTGRVINDTSMELYGFKKATEKNYYPIKVDRDFVNADVETVKFNKTIEGMGFLKSRIDSELPIVLESIADTSQNTIKQVSQFGGLAIPLRNFNKLINVTDYEMSLPEDETNSDRIHMVPTKSVKQMIQNTWGKAAYSYIENMLADLQEARVQPPNFMDKIRSNYAFSVLTANISTIIKQISAFPTVAATVGWKATGKAAVRGGKNNLPLSKAERELIDKYTPILWDRNRGNGTKELADIRDMSSFAQLPGIRKVKDAIQAVDVAMVGRFWYAAQYYVDDNYKNLKKGSDEYYRKTAEIFNRSVEETQSMNTVMQSSDLLRSPKQGVKMIFMFMSQNLQNLGIMYDSLGNLKAQLKTKDKAKIKEARKEFARAWSSQIVQAMMFSALAFVAGGVLHKMNSYRDDEEEITEEAILETLKENFVTAMLGSIPLADKVYELGKALTVGDDYYGIEVATVESVNDVGEYAVRMAKSIKKMSAGDEEEIEKGKENFMLSTKKLVGNLGNLTGAPVTNTINITEAIQRHVTDIVSGSGFLSYETGKEEPSLNVYGKKLYNAIINQDKGGQQEYKKKILARGKGQGDIESYVRKQLADNNEDIKKAAFAKKAGNLNTYKTIYNKLKSIGFTHNEIVGAVNSVQKKLEGSESTAAKGASEEKPLYEKKDLVRAIEEGEDKNADIILQQMYEEAMTKIEKDDEKHELSDDKKEKKAFASIRSKLSSEYKKKFQGAKNTHEKQIIIQKLYKLKIKGQCIYTNDIFEKWNEE